MLLMGHVFVFKYFTIFKKTASLRNPKTLQIFLKYQTIP
jgi:hypothetical protein